MATPLWKQIFKKRPPLVLLFAKGKWQSGFCFSKGDIWLEYVVKWQQPQTTLWNQNCTPSMTLQFFNNPISILLSTIQWRVRHKGNPTHVANSDEIRCGIHKEDDHYIIDCTKEQWFDDQWGQQSIIGGGRTGNEEQRFATVKVLMMLIVHQVWDPWRIDGGIVIIFLLTFPHSFLVCPLHAPASCLLFLAYILFPSRDILSFHVLPYCFYIASCTVCLLMHSPAQSAYSCEAY